MIGIAKTDKDALDHRKIAFVGRSLVPACPGTTLVKGRKVVK
jgi:hypothetical protein